MTATAPPTRRPALLSATAWVALGALMVGTAGLVLYLGRSTSFYYDEWNFVLLRRAWNVDALLMPHNEHLSVVPALVYKTLFSTVGIDSYVPYRVAGVIVHLIVLGLLFVYARRRVGDLLALGVVTIVAVLGAAWPDIMWPFQMGFVGSLAAGIGALLCLDRGDRRGEIGASVLLTVALASSSLGIPLFLAVAIEVLGRADRRARWKVLIAPAVLYALWWLGYHSSESRESIDNLLSTPAYVAEAAAAALGAVFGLGPEWGRPLVLGFVAAMVLALSRRPLEPWRLIALIALPLLFWALTGLARADLHEPGAPRYLYPGAVFILLIAVEALRGVRVPSRGALVALALLLAGITLSNLGALRNGAGFLRDQTADLDGALAAVELAAPHGVDPQFRPQPTVAPQIFAGQYLAAVKQLGSPVPPPSELPRGFGRTRAMADSTLRGTYGLTLTPVGSACRTAKPTPPAAAQDITVPSGGLEIDGAAKVFLRRFGDQFPPDPVGQATAGHPVALKIPPDASTAPWHARLVPAGPVRVC